MFADTSIRAVLPCPRGGSLALLAYPGLSLGIDGVAIIHPDILRSTFAALSALGCQRLYRLIEPSERLQPADQLVEDMAAAAGYVVRSLPIRDYSIPDFKTLMDLRHDRAARQALWGSGGCLALHCHAGAGRSGLIAAWLLMEQGLTVTDAIDQVRTHHPEAIETDAQVDWLTQQAAASGVA